MLFAACGVSQAGCASQIVSFGGDTRNVLAVCYTSDLLRGLLPTLLEQLEMCQKSLTAYLETKRAEFPRFYFVSDPTLLEILSLGSDPPSVVPHFQSGLFDSLSGVTFDKVEAAALCFCIRHTCQGRGPQEAVPVRLQNDKSKITEMFSAQGEKVEMEHPVEAKGGLLQSLSTHPSILSLQHTSCTSGAWCFDDLAQC